MRRTIARPRPDPSRAVPGARKKRSPRRGHHSSPTPGPSSSTDDRHRAQLAHDLDRDAAAGADIVQRVVDEIDQRLAQHHRIAGDHRVRVRAGVAEIDVRGERARHAFGDVIAREPCEIDRRPAARRRRRSTACARARAAGRPRGRRRRTGARRGSALRARSPGADRRARVRPAGAGPRAACATDVRRRR